MHGKKFFRKQLIKELAAASTMGSGRPNGDFNIFFVDGLKEGEADDVVPVEMAEEDVDFLFIFESVAEGADSCSCIDDEEGFSVAHFETAGIAPKTAILKTAD